ncbi:MAG: ArsR/SmtB family transcription factor [Chitinophagales bacterium]
MAYSKKHEFEAGEIQIAAVAKALGHPARIAILKMLSTGGCICGDLVQELPLSQSTVSQHLKELKTAGLIKGEIDGPRVCYCLDMKACKQALNFFQNLFTEIKCC